MLQIMLYAKESSKLKAINRHQKNIKREFHYNITPYKYKIKEATRIVPNEFIDFGSGILELIDQIRK